MRVNVRRIRTGASCPGIVMAATVALLKADAVLFGPILAMERHADELYFTKFRAQVSV